MPIAQNGTFGFARHKSQRFAKPKEPFFLPKHQHRSDIKTYLNRLKKEYKTVDGIKRTETAKGTKQSFFKNKAEQD
jgi:hypothetical protein